MHIQTFTGSSITALLTQVKEECGADAIILSTKEISSPKGILHEIMVGVEDVPHKKESLSISEPKEQRVNESYSSAFEERVQKELASLKESLFTVLRPSMRLERLTKTQRSLLEYLMEEGISEHVALMIYKKMLYEEGTTITSALQDVISLRPWGEKEWKSRIHCLVGTSGSGKSSSLLRMALHLVKENSSLRVVILNMDTERSYGKFFLRYFAGLSNIEYKEVAPNENIQDVLSSIHADRILIDMPSLPPQYTLARYLRTHGLEQATVHIVLCAGMSKHHIERTLERYKIDAQTSIIWTKLDEITAYGCLINTAVFFGIPISSLSYGTTVQNSLVPVTENVLWDIIFKHQLPL
ncbi:MAG: hypothetical protein K2M30_05320 [Desulfovibrionaceae bacterium]|nr:hypothetical protein [Desulfovibrionaceae bacterium]